MDVSVLISTVRPDLVTKTIDAVNNCKTEYEYEILVYSTENIERPNTKCIVQNPPCSTVFAYNMLYTHSKGSCIIVLADDHYLTGNVFGIFDELKSKKFDYSKFRMCHISPFKVGSERSPLPKDMGCDPQYSTLHFPALMRSVVEEKFNSCLQNPSFIHHYVDIWMGHFVSMFGEKVPHAESCKLVPLEPREINFRSTTNTKFDKYDEFVCRKLVSKCNSNLSYSHFLRIDNSFEEEAGLNDFIHLQKTRKEFHFFRLKDGIPTI